MSGLLKRGRRAIACHTWFGCGPAVAEIDTPSGWKPVCKRHFDLAWEDGYRVRKIQSPTPGLEAGTWGNQAIDPEYQR